MRTTLPKLSIENLNVYGNHFIRLIDKITKESLYPFFRAFGFGVAILKLLYIRIYA